MVTVWYVLNGERFKTLDEVVQHYNDCLSTGGSAITAYIIYSNNTKVGELNVDRLSAEVRRNTK